MATQDDSTLAHIKMMLQNHMIDSEWATGTGDYREGFLDALQAVLDECYGLRPDGLAFVPTEAAD